MHIVEYFYIVCSCKHSIYLFLLKRLHSCINGYYERVFFLSLRFISFHFVDFVRSLHTTFTFVLLLIFYPSLSQYFEYSTMPKAKLFSTNLLCINTIHTHIHGCCISHSFIFVINVISLKKRDALLLIIA